MLIVFVVVLLVVVVLLFVMGGVWYDWIYCVLVLFVIVCLCVLVILMLVMIVLGFVVVVWCGIFVKGGVYLEEGCKFVWFVFDKIGMIMYGKLV